MTAVLDVGGVEMTAVLMRIENYWIRELPDLLYL